MSRSPTSTAVVQLLNKQPKAKLTDDELGAALAAELPNSTSDFAKTIAGWRRGYNAGTLPGQESAPAQLVPRFILGEDGSKVQVMPGKRGPHPAATKAGVVGQKAALKTKALKLAKKPLKLASKK